MKIVVCIKQVPDTNEVKLDPKTNRLIRDGVPSIINHDDKSGIEAALQLREKVGGTVTVVCMGPPQADVALREALAMGCDDAYLLSAREFGGSDTCATAIIISTALKKIGYDLVITGRQAIDGDTAQVMGVPLNIGEIQEVFSIMQMNVEEATKAIEAAKSENMLIVIHACDSRAGVKKAAQKKAGNLSSTNGSTNDPAGGNEFVDHSTQDETPSEK